jgi:hypothetical protein
MILRDSLKRVALPERSVRTAYTAWQEGNVVIPDLDPSRGLLPPGRYRADRVEVFERFVDGRGEQRQRVWRN